MLHKKTSTKVLHKLFECLPDFVLHLFGTCKSACVGIAMEDNLENIKSSKVKAHLKVCSKCWNYYNQMKIINNKIVMSLKKEVDLKYDRSKERDSVEKLASRFSKQ